MSDTPIDIEWRGGFFCYPKTSSLDDAGPIEIEIFPKKKPGMFPIVGWNKSNPNVIFEWDAYGNPRQDKTWQKLQMKGFDPEITSFYALIRISPHNRTCLPVIAPSESELHSFIAEAMSEFASNEDTEDARVIHTGKFKTKPDASFKYLKGKEIV